jgi:hypothetical protein
MKFGVFSEKHRNRLKEQGESFFAFFVIEEFADVGERCLVREFGRDAEGFFPPIYIKDGDGKNLPTRDERGFAVEVALRDQG